MTIDYKRIVLNIENDAYRYIGSGSGRRVYDLGNGYVVKVAKNIRGIAQNEAEFRIAKADRSNIFAKIIGISEDSHFIVMQKAEKILHISEIWKLFDVKNNQELLKHKELREIAIRYDLLMQDLLRPANWGIINEKPVVVDFGFTKSVRKNYY